MPAPTRRIVLLLAVATVAGVAVAGPPATRPVDPAASTKPATRPASWHEKIVRYPDPLEDELRDDFGYDPAFASLEAPGGDVETREGAFRYLITTVTFAYEVVGAGASRSYQSRALETLAGQPDAGAIFLDLFERGGDVGKLYALCGLRHFEDSLDFAPRAQPFLQSQVTIRTFYCCFLGEDTVAHVADGIVHGHTSHRLLKPRG